MDTNLRATLLLLVILAVEFCYLFANANLVLPVQRKFKAPHTSLSAIIDHDSSRHGRFLSVVDVPLGGNGKPSSNGLYYTKIGLGSPAKDYYVQIDTGSDLLWVNCVGCTTCPKKSSIGMDLSLYDPKESKTSHTVSCDDKFCTSMNGPISGCKQDIPCQYSITYGDGSSTSGIYVKDYLTFNQVNGDLRTAPDNSSMIFGCGAKQSGTLGKSTKEALDGIIGFGEANSSVLSQLAASGKVKKVFSHCLDNIQGGGIFSIGEVVEPKVNTTSLVPRMAHYNVILKDIEVDGDFLQLPTDIFDSGYGRRTIIDSGTTLVYLPTMIYDQLMTKILARQPGLKFHPPDGAQFICFHYSENLDNGFPVVKFHFEGLSLIVYPHEYMFQYKEDIKCVGWQKSSTDAKNGKENILLGDLVLSNKIVIYDLENMEIGWKYFNCSSSIKVKDETTGTVYTVGAHKISSASTVLIGRILTLFLLLIAIINSLIG